MSESVKKNDLYIVTGAAGNLGSAIVRELIRREEKVRAFVLRGEAAANYLPKEAEIIEGDITDIASLRALFANIPESTNTYVIHCAAMVSVSNLVADKIWSVNVDGTQNIIDKCFEHKARLVFISSTGAIPELPKGNKITEVDSYDPDAVIGIYDKTKAASSQLVLDAVNNEGLDACIILPSGISGPGDYTFGNVAGVIKEYAEGKMPAGVEGTFNCGDSRDMANAILNACKVGRTGESYILGGYMFSMKQVFDILSEKTGLPTVKNILPASVGKILGKLSDLAETTTRKPQRMTSFAVYNLIRNNDFDYTKAANELGYSPRSMEESIEDEVRWMIEEKIISVPKQSTTVQPVHYSDWKEQVKKNKAVFSATEEMVVSDRAAFNASLAENYIERLKTFTVEENGCSKANMTQLFAEDANYWIPYFGPEKFKANEISMSLDEFFTAEMLAFMLVYPDWALLDYDLWADDNGFAARLHFGGTNPDGIYREYWNSSFIKTNEACRITDWNIIHSANYNAFLDDVLGEHGPFESMEPYFEAIMNVLNNAGINMHTILDL